MTKKHPDPLKIGLIANPGFGSRYVHEFMDWIRVQQHLQLTCVVIEKGEDTDAPSASVLAPAPGVAAPIGWLQKTLLYLLTAAEGVLLLKYPEHREHLRTCDIEKGAPGVLYAVPRFTGRYYVYQYNEQTVREIKDLRLDLLVKFSPGILYGEVATAARLGGIALHYQDERTNRNGPPGFWEVYSRQATSGFTIQRICADPGTGETLMRGQSSTQWFYLLNQVFLFKKANYHLKETVRKIASGAPLRSREEPQPYYNRRHTYPSLPVQFAYLSKTLALLAKKMIKPLLVRRHLEWGVSFCRNDWPDVEMCQGIKLKSEGNCYLADPFVVRHGDSDFCFVEEYDCKARKGHISAYEIRGDASKRLGRIIDEKFHMSFPYVFRFGNDLYMCPETSEKKQIRLYKCSNFPLEWTLSEVLMDDVAAVDSMIFEKDGTWWLFTNISDPPELEDFSTQLCIFYADTPFSKRWRPHPKNPIVIDAFKGRNAGLLTNRGVTYRVSQKQAFDVYGESFSINEISVLNKDDYVERELCSVAPNFFPKLERTHHMHSNNAVTVFDFGPGTLARILG